MINKYFFCGTVFCVIGVTIDARVVLPDYFGFLPAQESKKLVKEKLKVPTIPMLPKNGDVVPQVGDWLYERKLDGQRCIAVKQGATVQLFSRNQKLVNTHYPELVEALQRQTAENFIVDGEIVAFDGDTTSFPKLQERMFVKHPSKTLQRSVPVRYAVFDVLHLNGFDTTRLSLINRKQLLKRMIDGKAPLFYVEHKVGGGSDYFKYACQQKWEGLVAKRTLSTYQYKRTTDWLKLKCMREQEFVIGGYTRGRGKRKECGALLLGYYDHAQLHYVGKVGAGFTNKMLEVLMQQLKPLQQKSSPFSDHNIQQKNVCWVKPVLVAAVVFDEWTMDGKLRHPRFLGLRTDKEPAEVTRDMVKVLGK